jgi:hypothetical protein
MAKITIKAIQKLFEAKLIYSSEYLKKYFDCTYQCIWDNFKKVGYYSSFTHNSKYYTLATIPKFDEQAIWFHTDPEAGEVGFTKQKTASRLLVSLINSSPAGVTEDSLKKIMKIRLANHLSNLVKASKIRKLKIKHKYYYLSINPKQYQAQYTKLMAAEKVASPPPADSFSKEPYYRSRLKRLMCGRENWRQRANEKQQTIRAQLIRIRDLERSRDKWKSIAMKYKRTVKQLQTTLDPVKKTPESAGGQKFSTTAG